MSNPIQEYNKALSESDKALCDILFTEINKELNDAESKIWHRHPVWFLEGNPVVGYVKMKEGVRLLFWSGQSFDDDELVAEGSFKAAEKRYFKSTEIKKTTLKRWLTLARNIQWDYKNLVKRKGKLERLK